MNLKKPKNHTAIDMYKAWCRETLANNKDYFGAYDARLRQSGTQIIYKKSKPVLNVKEPAEGIIDGKNKEFTTKSPRAYEHTGRRSKTIIYKNGVKLKGSCKHKDYGIKLNKITMTEAPKVGDVIEITYSTESYDIVMSYTMFRLIIETFNKYAMETVIQGESVTLGSNLGYIYPACIERNFNKPKCDIVATIKVRKETPEHPAIYFTDDDYCMIKWKKFHKLQNESVYIFRPAKIFGKLFYKALRGNPILKTLYIFIPYKQYTHGTKVD